MVKKVVQTAYAMESVEGTRIILANDDDGIAVSVEVGDSEPVEFTITSEDATALPRLLGKLNRESGRVVPTTRGPRTQGN